MIRARSNRMHAASDRGAMLLSLDLELAWGTRGRPSASKVGPYLDGTRNAVERMLELCVEYEVPATWAIVGGLLLGEGPDKTHCWLNDEQHADIPRGTTNSQPHWYAEDIVRSIKDCKTVQEIGCHTLTHMYVDPTPRGREPFRIELQRFRQLFDQRGWPQPITFIYPKAMMGHFDVLAEEGFLCYRGPEPRWYETLPTVRLPAALRMLDGKLALRPNVDFPERTNEGLWMLPSSQFYSPRMSVGRHVSTARRVQKAHKGLQQAAKSGGVFHLWTHPFNMGQCTDELMGGLKQIFHEAASLRDAGKLELLTMGDLTLRLSRNKNQPNQE
ncbi:MAG: polysaccharide deacetylase family protein [Rubripirellula sp.]|nr:polysaccharide deacetylase family protein [Rubripirellula sp.]